MFSHTQIKLFPPAACAWKLLRELEYKNVYLHPPAPLNAAVWVRECRNPFNKITLYYAVLDITLMNKKDKIKYSSKIYLKHVFVLKELIQRRNTHYPLMFGDDFCFQFKNETKTRQNWIEGWGELRAVKRTTVDICSNWVCLSALTNGFIHINHVRKLGASMKTFVFL